MLRGFVLWALLTNAGAIAASAMQLF